MKFFALIRLIAFETQTDFVIVQLFDLKIVRLFYFVIVVVLFVEIVVTSIMIASNLDVSNFDVRIFFSINLNMCLDFVFVDIENSKYLIIIRC